MPESTSRVDGIVYHAPELAIAFTIGVGTGIIVCAVVA